MRVNSTPTVLGGPLVTAVVIVVLSIKLSTFRDYQIAEIAIEVTAVAGLTVLTGLSGQISLGNGAFMAIGAYTTALLLAVGFRYTSAGLRMRAAAFNATVARLSGIRVARVITVGWALAGLLGALAGVLVSPSTFLYPNSMDSIFVFGFTAAVIGGLDSPAGAVVGGLLLGVVLSYAGGYLGSQGSDLTALVALGILVVVLMLRPDGIFSGARVRRV